MMSSSPSAPAKRVFRVSVIFSPRDVECVGRTVEREAEEHVRDQHCHQREPHRRADRSPDPGRTTRREESVVRSEEHTSELQSLMRISYAVFCLKKKRTNKTIKYHTNNYDNKNYTTSANTYN